MKDRKAICLFCRHSSTPRKPLRIPQRWMTYPTRQEREPYVLPRLVIDLDAADSPHVKNYDDMPEKEQERNLGGHVVHRVPANGLGDKLLRSRRTPSWYSFDKGKQIPSPVDLISYVLRAEADSTLMGKVNRGKVYNRTGRKPENGLLRKVQELASTYIVDERARLRQTGFTFSNDQMNEIETTIASCHDFMKLQLLISTLSSTKEGCGHLASPYMGEAISNGIRLCRKQQGIAIGVKVTPSALLRMLNNLYLNMKSKGVDFGPNLSNRALYYAAKVGSLSAIKIYLEVFRRGGYPVDFYGCQAASELVISFLERESHSDSTSSSSQTYRKDLLAILTGYEDGVRKEVLDQEFNFRSAVNTKSFYNSNLYREYIFAIAQLGLGDKLWAEWELILENGIIPKQERRGMRSEAEIPQFFALAFLISGDSNRAYEILSAVPVHSPEVFEELHTAKIRDRHSKVLRGLIYDHYKALNLEAIPDLWQRVRRDLTEVPQDPEGALELLQRYLLSDYERGVQKRRAVIEKVEDGGMGEMLMVWPLKEGGPLFAKALTGRDTSI